MSKLPSDEFNKGQQAFIEQMARKLLVQWCHDLMTSSDPNQVIQLSCSSPYVQYAANRKSPWISEKHRVFENNASYKILASGWNAAASFLKR